MSFVGSACLCTGTLEFAALKGTIYHFRISAINEEGEGPWGGAADYGTVSTPRYVTLPAQRG